MSALRPSIQMISLDTSATSKVSAPAAPSTHEAIFDERSHYIRPNAPNHVNGVLPSIATIYSRPDPKPLVRIDQILVSASKAIHLTMEPSMTTYFILNKESGELALTKRLVQARRTQLSRETVSRLYQLHPLVKEFMGLQSGRNTLHRMSAPMIVDMFSLIAAHLVR
jgi:hypothetical protein